MTVTIEDRDKPAAPTDLTLVLEDKKLIAKWTQPLGPVTSYQLRYRKTAAIDPSTGWTTITPSGTETSAEIIMLTDNTPYYVQVRANDGQEDERNGWSEWSASQSHPSLGSPRNVMACSGDNRVILEWLSPTDAGWAGNRRIGYQIRHNSSYQKNLFSPFANKRKITITAGTHNGTPYATNGQTETWQVRSVGESLRHRLRSGRDKIYSAWADAPTVTIGQASQPTNLTVTPGLHKLDVSWKAPGCNIPVDSYDVHYTRNATVADDATAVINLGAGWVAANRSDPSSTRETLDEITTALYRVRVRAVTSNGDGPWSDVKSGAPKTTVSFTTSDDEEIQEGNPGYLELKPGRRSDFEGTLAFNIESSSDPAASISEDFDSYPATYNLTTNVDMVVIGAFVAKADGIQEYDEFLAVSLVESPQLIPTGITTRRIKILDRDPITDPVINFKNSGGEQQFTSSWTKLEGPVTEYELIWREQEFETYGDPEENRKRPVVGDPNDSNAGWTSVDVVSTSTNTVRGVINHTVENLEHGTHYEMYVRATDGLVEDDATVWSPWSEQGATATDRDPDLPPPEVTPPDPDPETVYPPQNIKAVSNASGKLTVSWRLHGQPVDSCTYRYRAIITHEDAVQNIYGPPTDELWTCKAEYEFTGLTPGRYSVSVAASIVNNVGKPSDPISVIVAGGPILSLDKSAALYDSATETWAFRETQDDKLTLSLSQALTDASTVTIEAIPDSCTKIACDKLYKNLPGTIDLPSGQTSVIVNMPAEYLGDDDVTNSDKVRGSFKFRLVRTPNAPYALRDTEAENLVLEDGNKLTLSFDSPVNQIIVEGSTADINITTDREADFPITIQLRTRPDRECSDLVAVDHYDADACANFTAGDTALHPDTTVDATKNTDYIDQDDLTIHLPAHTREASISIPIKADLEVEPENEFFIAWILDPDLDRVEVGPDVVVVQIVDVALISFVKTEEANWDAADNRFEYTEGLSQDSTTTNGVTTYTEHGKLKLSLSRALDRDVIVRIEVVPNSCSDTDCTAYKDDSLPIAVTFSEGETEAEIDFANFHLREDNQIAESTETFQIRLAYPKGLRGEYAIKDSVPETVQFTDDDVVTLSFSPTWYTVSEGIPATIGINSDKVTNFDIPITITTRPDQFCSDTNDNVYKTGSIDPDTCEPPDSEVSIPKTKPDLGNPANTPDATLNVDYSVPNPITTLRAGSTRTDVSIATLRDSVADEPEEHLIVTMDIPADIPGRVEVGPDAGGVTIEDSTTKISLSATGTEVNEGESITVTIRASGEHGQVSIPLEIDQGDAESGDYSVPSKVKLPAGSLSVTFTIETIVDTDIDDETFTVGLGDLPLGYVADGPSIGITIKDPDTQGQEEEDPIEEEEDPPEEEVPPLSLPQVICDSPERQVGRAFSCDLPSASGGTPDYTYTASPLPEGLTLLSVNDKQSIVGTPTKSGSWTVSYTVTDSQDETQTQRFEIIIEAATPLEISILEYYSSPNAGSPEGEPVIFTLELSRSADFEVSINYTTARSNRGVISGTSPADPGDDFVQVSGTATFEPGVTSIPISISTIVDSVDEGREYFEFSISDPSPSDRVVIEKYSVRPRYGYIKNDGDLQTAWLSRLGRTVSSQIYDSVSNRLSDDRDSSNSLIVSGRSVSDFLMVRNSDTDSTPTVVPLPQPELVTDLELNPNQPSETSTSIRDLNSREIFQGSSFNYTTDTPTFTLSTWGEVVSNSFAGVESTRNGPLTLSGNVTTGILGIDVDLGRSLAGVAISHSESLGSWTSPVDTGELSTTMIAFSPYARFTLNPTLTLWGVAGLGRGDMYINADTVAPAELAHIAFGTRAALPDLAGIDWSLKADALLTQLDTAHVPGSAKTNTATSRTRLILEGSKSITLADDHILRPTFELGIRHDDGDAETGAGLELGTGLDYTHPIGLTLAARTRHLLTHADAEFTEFGASFSAAYNTQIDGQGLTLSFNTTIGNATSSTAQLWQARTPTDFIRNTSGYLPPTGYNAVVGYGFPLAHATVLALPTLGINRGYDGSISWRFGTIFRPVSVKRASFEVSLDTTLSNYNDQSEYGLMLQGSTRW